MGIWLYRRKGIKTAKSGGYAWMKSAGIKLLLLWIMRLVFVIKGHLLQYKYSNLLFWCQICVRIMLRQFAWLICYLLQGRLCTGAPHDFVILNRDRTPYFTQWNATKPFIPSQRRTDLIFNVIRLQRTLPGEALSWFCIHSEIPDTEFPLQVFFCANVVSDHCRAKESLLVAFLVFPDSEP